MTIPNGANIWFSDDRWVYCPAQKCTYGTYTDVSGNNVAVRIDDVTGAMTLLGTLRGGYSVNDHYSGCVILLPDGRVAFFYPLLNGTDLAYRILTPSNGSIAPEVAMGLTVPGPYSYANAYYISSGNRLAIFFQQNATSTNGLAGNTWAMASNFNLLATNTWSVQTFWTGANGNATYLKGCSNGVDRISLLLTDWVPQPAQIAKSYNINFVAVSSTASQWQDSFGNDIGAGPLWSSPFTAATLVMAGASFGNLWIWQIAHALDGSLVALHVVYPDNTETNQRYHCARLAPGATSWTSSDMGFASNRSLNDSPPALRYYAPGVCFDGNDPRIAYAAVMDSTGSRLEQWGTTDFGTWTVTKVVAAAETGADKKKFRPFSPKGYAAGAVAVVYGYGTYTDISNFNPAPTAIMAPTPPTPRELARLAVVADMGNSATVRDWAALS